MHTTMDLVRRYGVSRQRLHQLAKARGVEPIARTHNAVLWDDAGADALRPPRWRPENSADSQAVPVDSRQDSSTVS